MKEKIFQGAGPISLKKSELSGAILKKKSKDIGWGNVPLKGKRTAPIRNLPGWRSRAIPENTSINSRRAQYREGKGKSGTKATLRRENNHTGRRMFDSGGFFRLREERVRNKHKAHVIREKEHALRRRIRLIRPLKASP